MSKGRDPCNSSNSGLGNCGSVKLRIVAKVSKKRFVPFNLSILLDCLFCLSSYRVFIVKSFFCNFHYAFNLQCIICFAQFALYSFLKPPLIGRVNLYLTHICVIFECWILRMLVLVSVDHRTINHGLLFTILWDLTGFTNITNIA